jgi:hypothetical protein
MLLEEISEVASPSVVDSEQLKRRIKRLNKAIAFFMMMIIVEEY